jgi:hypothetical protein
LPLKAFYKAKRRLERKRRLPKNWRATAFLSSLWSA